LWAQGCARQGSIARNHVERFKGRLVKGHAYYLHYLEVREARDTFRAVDHSFEAWLTKWTEITEISPVPESLPRYHYKLRSFQSLLASVGDRTYLAGIFSGAKPFVGATLFPLIVYELGDLCGNVGDCCLCDCRCGGYSNWCISCCDD
jgi:hypothetical protein